jgi:uroporphyrinogen decarboxylase
LNESKLQTVESPLKDADLENLRDFDWPEYELVRDAGGLGLEARQLYHQTQLALVGRLAGPILTIARDLRGEEKWQQDLVDNPDFACALLNRIAGIQIDLDEAGLRFAGRYLSIVEVNELSLAPQAVRLSAPGIWRHTIRPVLERRWRAARLAMQRYAPQAKLMFSSNFTQPAILEEMIDGGIDLVGPLQPASGDADFSGLKRDYGRRISFYGGVDGAHLLSAANEAEVRKVIETCLKQLGPGGGFILAPSQTVQAGALPQNIVAMCETAKVYGRYSSL